MFSFETRENPLFDAQKKIYQTPGYNFDCWANIANIDPVI